MWDIRTCAGNTTLPSDVAGTVKPERTSVARGRFCDKIAGTMLQNIHRIELFATFFSIMNKAYFNLDFAKRGG